MLGEWQILNGDSGSGNVFVWDLKSSKLRLLCVEDLHDLHCRGGQCRFQKKPFAGALAECGCIRSNRQRNGNSYAVEIGDVR